MRKADTDGKQKAPADRFADVEPSPGIPTGSDGAPAPQLAGIAVAASEPEWTADSCICLRGPCRHYWELISHFDAGNPEGTFGEGGIREALAVDPATGEVTLGPSYVSQPRQINRACLVNPGFETELTGDLIYSCNRWDPETKGTTSTTIARDMRRRAYYTDHPEHEPCTGNGEHDGSDGTQS